MNIGSIIKMLDSIYNDTEEEFNSGLRLLLAESCNQIHSSKQLSKVGLMSTSMTVKVFEKCSRTRNAFTKSTVVLNSMGFSQVTLKNLSHKINMAQYNWLVYSDADVSQFQNVILPYNCKFIKVSVFVSGEHLLQELYKIHEPSEIVVNDLGTWRIHDGIFFKSTSGFYGRRLNFAGAALNYLTNKLDVCVDTSVAEGLVTPCIHEKVWHLIVETLNATTNAIYLSHKLPQFLSKEFREGNAQMAIATTYMSSETVAIVDFFWPTFTTHLQVFTRFSGLERSWSRYLKPFSDFIWYSVLGWIAFCCSIFELARHLAKKYLPDEHRFNMHQVWSPIFAFLSQGTTEPAGKVWERLLLASAFLAPAVLIPAYNAALTSFLTVNAPEMPFTTLEEMKYHPSYKLSPIQFFRIEEVLERSYDETSQYLLNYAMVPYEQRPQTSVDGFKRMCRDRFSYIETDFGMAAIKPACQFYKLRKPIASFHTSMVMPKHSPYMNAFNFVSTIIRFSGILLTLKYSLTKNQIMDLFLENEKSAQLPTIDFEAVVLLISALGFSILLSFTILVAEIFTFKIKNSSKKRGRERKIISKSKLACEQPVLYPFVM